MIEFKKNDLLFLTKLELIIELSAITCVDENNKKYWKLHVKAINNTFTQEGFYHGARGEVRRFYQLNVLYETCCEIFENAKKLTIYLKD